ncbi:MAG TPA: hypothetical protein VMZ73_02065 [Acidimicrobiales bacterium]|nr:hypothetical protein [Acidimicrobiales bacterium]
MSAPTRRRLWVVAGAMLVAHVGLLFASAAFTHSLQLGDDAAAAAAALSASSMPRSFVGGYLGLLAFLDFLVAAMLLASLLRRDGEASTWLSSCVAASAITYVAVTLATGFAAGAAALYDGHHGAPLAAVTVVNDIRNFGFVLCGAVVGVFALSVAAAARISGDLPRWVSLSGFVVGLASVATVPGARSGLVVVSTMLSFLWLAALGVAAIREGGRTMGFVPGAAAVPV